MFSALHYGYNPLDKSQHTYYHHLNTRVPHTLSRYCTSTHCILCKLDGTSSIFQQNLQKRFRDHTQYLQHHYSKQYILWNLSQGNRYGNSNQDCRYLQKGLKEHFCTWWLLCRYLAGHSFLPLPLSQYTHFGLGLLVQGQIVKLCHMCLGKFHF